MDARSLVQVRRMLDSDAMTHAAWSSQYHDLRVRLLQKEASCGASSSSSSVAEALHCYEVLRRQLTAHGVPTLRSRQLPSSLQTTAEMQQRGVVEHATAETESSTSLNNSSGACTTMFLSQLSLPDVGFFGGLRSKCTTDTQDVDLDSSCSNSSLASRDADDLQASDPSFVNVSSARFEVDKLETTEGGFYFAATPRILGGKFGAITCVEFSGKDNHLAAGTASGVVLLYQDATEAADTCFLEGHTSYVTDITWSDSDQYLLSVSLDSFAIAWDIVKQIKVRQIHLQHEPLVARFLPRNNNFFLVGLRATAVHVFNLSTGMLVKKVRCVAAVGAMAVDIGGTLFFTGDARGFIAVYVLHLESGTVKRSTDLGLQGSAPVTSLQCLPSSAAQSLATARCAHILLANARNNTIFVMFVEKSNDDYRIVPVRQVSVAQRTLSIRSAFCDPRNFGPSISFVTGSESGQALVFSLGQTKTHLAAELTASGNCAVVDVSWSSNATVLALGTNLGHIYLWRRIIVSGSEVDSSKFFVENCRSAYQPNEVHSDSSPRGVQSST